MPFYCMSNAKSAKLFFAKNAYSGGLPPRCSTSQTSNQTPRKLGNSKTPPKTLKSTSKDGFVAQEMKRRSVLLAAPLLFLPVTGCSEDGFYDTGKKEN
jgi:hypothetical protein